MVIRDKIRNFGYFFCKLVRCTHKQRRPYRGGRDRRSGVPVRCVTKQEKVRAFVIPAFFVFNFSHLDQFLSSRPLGLICESQIYTEKIITNASPNAVASCSGVSSLMTSPLFLLAHLHPKSVFCHLIHFVTFCMRARTKSLRCTTSWLPFFGLSPKKTLPPLCLCHAYLHPSLHHHHDAVPCLPLAFLFATSTESQSQYRSSSLRASGSVFY